MTRSPPLQVTRPPLLLSGRPTPYFAPVAPTRFSPAVKRVLPVPLHVPPDQLNVLPIVSVPVPVITPPLKLVVAAANEEELEIVWGPPASSSVPLPLIILLPRWVKSASIDSFAPGPTAKMPALEPGAAMRSTDPAPV